MLRPRSGDAERYQCRNQDKRAQASAYRIPIAHDSPLKTFRDAVSETGRDASLEICVLAA
jgi:hypothetical protein